MHMHQAQLTVCYSLYSIYFLVYYSFYSIYFEPVDV